MFFRITVLVTVLLSTCWTVAQDFSGVNDLQSARNYCAANEKAGVAFIHREIQNSALFLRFDQKRSGDTVIVGNYAYKILEKDRLLHYRFEYIYLNSNQLGKERSLNERDTILNRLKRGVSFADLHDAYNMDANGNNGDIGWVTLTELPSCLQETLPGLQVGEVSSCEVEGTVFILRAKSNPKWIKGRYAVYDLMEVRSSYEKEVFELVTPQQISDFVKKNPEVSLQLFDEYHDVIFFRELESAGSQRFEKIFEYENQKVRIFRDTLITLVDFDYIYIGPEGDKGIVERIKLAFDEGEDFDRLIDQFGNPDKRYHAMERMDSGLIHPELVRVILPLKKGELCAVPIGEAVFICKVNEPSIVAKAYLGLVFQ